MSSVCPVVHTVVLKCHVDLYISAEIIARSFKGMKMFKPYTPWLTFMIKLHIFLLNFDIVMLNICIISVAIIQSLLHQFTTFASCASISLDVGPIQYKDTYSAFCRLIWTLRSFTFCVILGLKRIERFTKLCPYEHLTRSWISRSETTSIKFIQCQFSPGSWVLKTGKTKIIRK